MLSIDFNPLVWTRVLAAVAIFFQSIELLMLRSRFSDQGIWRWEFIKRDLVKLPIALRWILGIVLPYRQFIFLLVLRTIAALGAIFSDNGCLMLFLLLSTLAISIRWRGTFNGGSDYMTIIVVSALSVAQIFPDNPSVALGCIYYIAIQTCLSYFIAGFIKLRSVNWRSGAALHAFLISGPYDAPKALLAITRRPIFAVPLSWSVMIFECGFPLALAGRFYAVIFIIAGLMFHAVNVYLLGLNRFLFIWIATYPVVLWLAR